MKRPKYKDCTKIKNEISTCWLISFEDGSKEIAIWSKKANIEDIINYINLRNLGMKFTVLSINAGLFKIKKSDHYYSSDARRLNQNKRMIFPGDKKYEFNRKKKVKIKRRESKDIPF